MNDILTEEVALCGDNMSQQDSNAIVEIIYEALADRGIFTESFCWSLDVEYVPAGDLDD